MTLGKCPLSIFCSRGTPPRALLFPPSDTTPSSQSGFCPWVYYLAHKKGWISTPCSSSSRISVWYRCLRPTTVFCLCVCCFSWHNLCLTVWFRNKRATGPQLLNICLLFFLDAPETSGLISSPNSPPSRISLQSRWKSPTSLDWSCDILFADFPGGAVLLESMPFPGPFIITDQSSVHSLLSNMDPGLSLGNQRAKGPQLLNACLLFFLDAPETSGLISFPNSPPSQISLQSRWKRPNSLDWSCDILFAYSPGGAVLLESIPFPGPSINTDQPSVQLLLFNIDPGLSLMHPQNNAHAT